VLDEGKADEADFMVWPDNWRTLELFIACRRQWSYGAMGGAHGLRAEGVESVLRMNRVPIKDQWTIFTDLMAMADEALPVMNQKND
jgi:hypothetical protein